MKISRKTSISIPTEFFEDLENDVTKQIAKDIDKAKEQILSRASKLAIEALKKHPVYKSIEGRHVGSRSGADLQAELGLTQDVALKALSLLEYKIIEHIGFTIDTRYGKRVTGLILNLDLADNYKDSIKGYPFEYVSQGESGKPTTIYWMQFLLSAANELITTYIADIDKYGIVFKNWKGGRTKDAFMTPNPNFADRFPYRISKNLISFDGENFVEDTFNNRQFRKNLGDIVESVLDQIII